VFFKKLETTILLAIRSKTTERVKKISSPRALLKKLGLVLLLFLIVSLQASLFPNKVLAQGNKKVVLITIDKLSLDELAEADAPFLKKLAKEGTVGLLNCRSAGFIVSNNTYLTIGCGAYANGGAFGEEAFNSKEIVDGPAGLEAGKVFEHRTGLIPPEGSIVNLGIADIARRNAELPYAAVPGLLGSILKESGFKVAVLGNADINDEAHREVCLIAMDEKGIVLLGDVGSSLYLKDPSVLGGYRTNYDILLSSARGFLKKADLLVIELGDISRIDSQSKLADETVVVAQKTKALKNIDQFVGSLLGTANSKDTLVIIASPTPSLAMLKEKARLNPLIISGPDFKGGTLSSDTTRRHGIVTNTDIAPTIFSFLGTEIPYQASGRPIFAVSQNEPVPYLLNLKAKATAIYQTRNTVLTMLTLFIVASILISLFIAFAKYQGKTIKKEKHIISQLLLLWVLSLPLAFLFQPTFVTKLPGGAAFFSFALALILAVLSFWRCGKNTFQPIMVISIATSFALLCDAILGSKLMLQSFLGSCPIAGGRFYGLGNTYMGTVVGSSIVGITALTAKFHKNRRSALIIVTLFLLAVCVVIGYSKFGANVGGLITMLGASLITWIKLKGERVSWRRFLYIALIALLFFALIISADLLAGSGQSHAGRALEFIKTGGTGAVFDIMSRKLTMNIRGIKSTPWGGILAVIVLLLPMALTRLEQSKQMTSELRWFFQGLMGVSAGAIFALIFNDTGIVAAGMIIVYVWVSLLYILLSEREMKFL